MSILIAKADGTSEAFERSKLISSLERAGAKSDIAQNIAQEIEKRLESGTSTHVIYSKAFARLRDFKKAAAARYSLKRAVLEFGPSGFPFESYIGELFKTEGFETRIDQLVRGKCVEHEVDVVITKGEETIYAEAKFHNAAGFKTDLKVVLYVKARIDDIGQGRGLVVTNTKFTDKAIEYAKCANLELLSWDYPQGNTLHNRIEKAGLYPITAITSLSTHEKTALLSDRIVLCESLSQNPNVLSRIGVSGDRATEVLEEVGALCAR